LGGLSYTGACPERSRGNADGRRTAVGGSLAQTGMPAGASGNTFNADNAMTKFNGTSMSGACPERSRRNAMGELTSDGTNTYTWNARHQLTQIMQGRTVTAAFAYDAFGRRISKSVGASTTDFLYDGLNPVQEQTSGGSVTANLLTGLNIDEYFTRTASGTTSTFLADALGSTIGLVTANGGPIATSYSYEPFGATTQGGAGNTNPYQFTGRENDGSGLYYYRARYYSPSFQRFVSQDPLSFSGGDPNLYEYAGDSPLIAIDPLGLWSIRISGYALIGGSITFGKNPGGGGFLTAEGGFGVGGGAEFDPLGSSPGYKPSPCGHPRHGIGAGSDFNLGAGLFGLDVAAGLQNGTNIFSNGYEDYQGTESPHIALGNDIGLSGGVSYGYYFTIF
jgi:RHS repeat-associated protein